MRFCIQLPDLNRKPLPAGSGNTLAFGGRRGQVAELMQVDALAKRDRKRLLETFERCWKPAGCEGMTANGDDVS